MIPNLFHSEDIAKIAEALSKVLPKIEAATKDKENPHFRSKYADLSSIMDGEIQTIIDQLIVAENAERLKEAQL